jgi:hypothetical protein
MFNGGLNTRAAKHLLNAAQSTVCNNVDFFDGSLKPLKGIKATPWMVGANNKHFTRFNGQWVSGGAGVHFVEYNDALYKSDSAGVIKKSKNGTTFFELGITKPAGELVASTRDIVFTLTANAYVPLLGTGVAPEFPSGTLSYIIGYKTTADKYFKKELKLDTTGVKSITIYKSDIGVDVASFKVYRKYEGTYYLIKESDEYGYVQDTTYNISKNEAYSSFDWISTAAVRSYVYTYYSTSTGFESAPCKVSNEIKVEALYAKVTGFTVPTDPSVDAIKLYRMGGTLTDFFHVVDLAINSTEYNDSKTDTEVLNEEGLLNTYSNIKPPSTLRFITEYNNSLFACLDTQLWFSEPGIVDTWKSTNWIQFPEHITGLGATANGLLVFSRNKTWIIVGEDTNSYSKYLLSNDQGCVTHNTIQFTDNVLLWYSLDGICSSNGGAVDVISFPALGKLVLEPVASCVSEKQYYLFHDEGTIVVDFRESMRFYTLGLKVKGASYISEFDAMYVLIPSSIGIHKYNDGEDLSFKYKTGKLTEGELTNYKTYKVIYVYSKGANTISILLDDLLVIDKVALIDGLNEILLPQYQTKGYGIEIEFSGTGTIYEVEYKVEGRQNGV